MAARVPRIPDNIIVIIIKKGRQFKAERVPYTPYQSEDHIPHNNNYRQK